MNALDEETMSALHWACAYGEVRIISSCSRVQIRIKQAEIVKIFLADPRVDILIKNKRGGTPLHQASLSGTHDVMRILLSDPRIKAAVDDTNTWG